MPLDLPFLLSSSHLSPLRLPSANSAKTRERHISAPFDSVPQPSSRKKQGNCFENSSPPPSLPSRSFPSAKFLFQRQHFFTFSQLRLLSLTLPSFPANTFHKNKVLKLLRISFPPNHFFNPSLSSFFFCPPQMLNSLSQTHTPITRKKLSNMKATNIITTLVALAPLVPASSAWHLKLFRNEQYSDIIVDREGHLSQPCAVLAREKNNVASSLQWDSGWLSNCAVELYEQPDCTVILGNSQEADWNLPRFSSLANNKVSSYLINC